MSAVRMRSLALSVALLAWTPFACDSERGGFSGADGGSFGQLEAGIDAPNDCVGRVRCSRNLRAIVDACDEAKVLTTCPDDQGCADGRCVPACEATAQNSASMGCEFATVPPAHFIESEGSCFAAFMANTWTVPAEVELEYAGRPLDVKSAARVVHTSNGQVTYDPFSGAIQPGEVIVLFLAQSEDPNPFFPQFWVPCPDGVKPGVLRDTSLHETTRGSSFRLKTTMPVSTYSMFPFGGAKSMGPTATLLLPVPSWKKGYVVTDAWERHIGIYNDVFPATQIIAAEDDTEVTLIGNISIQSGNGVEGAGQGVPHTYRLGRGEVLQFVQLDELTGSRISANKNVAVFGGHECLKIPAPQAACDTSQLQLLPVQSWGREYAAVPHLSRRAQQLPEDYFYRIVAAVDGTILTYDPLPSPTAPATLGAGGVTTFSTRAPFVVKSQDAEHPIAVYAYMSGAEFSQAQALDGDPEFSFVVPTEQFLDRYVFYVDPTYRNSQLVVVRTHAPGKDYEPVTLDCAGPLEGWQAFGSSNTYEFVRISLTRYFANQKVGHGTCGPGRHEIESKGPFGVAIWGTDTYASYGYPGGAAIRTLNDVETIIR